MVSHTALFGVLAALASVASAAGAPSVDLSYARRNGADGSITYNRAAVARNFPRANNWANLERRQGCQHGAWSCANNVLQICNNGAAVPMHDCTTIGAICTTAGWVGCLPNGMTLPGGGAATQPAPPAAQPAPPATPAPAPETNTGSTASAKDGPAPNMGGVNPSTGVTPAPDYLVEMVDGSPFDPNTDVCIEWEDETPPPPPPPKKSCGKQQTATAPVDTPATTPDGIKTNTGGQNLAGQLQQADSTLKGALQQPVTEPKPQTTTDQTQTPNTPAQAPTPNTPAQAPTGKGPKSLVQAPYYVVYNQETPLPADPAELGPINVINLAFWTTPKLDTYAAQFLKDPNRKQIIDAYHKAGKVIMLAAFGQFDDPTEQDPVEVAKKIAKIVKDEGLDGIDCDLEHGLKVGEKGAQWGIDFTKAARAELGPDYFISHAPQGPHFTDTLFEYNKIVKGAGDDIDFYNIQYYNQYPAPTYSTCDRMVVKDTEYAGSALAELHASGIPWEKLVLGKPLIPTDANNLWMEPEELAKCVAQGKALGWPGSFMTWALHAPADAVKTYNTVIGAK